jgi:phospholipid transport system substrate-binding protein
LEEEETEMSYERIATDPRGLLPRDRGGSSSGIRHEGAMTPTTRAAKLAKGFIVALAVIAGVATAPRPATAGATTAEFIRNLGDQALAVIRSDATPAQKAVYLRQMLRQDFALTDISRFVLGPYWRVANAAQPQEFGQLLEDRVMRFYGERLAQYGSRDFRVTGSRADPAGVTVTSQILRPQGPPIEVDWQLAVSDGPYKITDVAIDGASLVLAQRAEFASIIERNGGRLGGVLTAMRKEG